MMDNILIATDGTASADEALDVAIEMARESNAALNILSVRRPRPAGRGGAGPAVLEVEMRDGPKRIAEAAARRAREAGVPATPHVAYGDIVDTIADAANTLGADHLVVGSRGLGSMSAAVLGSVSHALVRRSPVPLTIVRRPAVHA
jgi:nucleotide-binding universal stress UspA family protein